HNAVRTFDPDLSVLLLGAWETLDFIADGKLLWHGAPEHAQELRAIAPRAIAPLLARGGRVALLEVPPFGNPSGDPQYGSQRSDPASVADVNDALRSGADALPE